MQGAQAVVLLFALLVLPVVAVLAWWSRRRFIKAVVRFQKAASLTPKEHDIGATAAHSRAIPGRDAPPKLTLRIRPACDVAESAGSGDRTAAPRRLRRRVLAVQFIGGLLYWGGLFFFLAWVIGGPLVFAMLEFLGPSMLLFVLMPAGIAWFLQAGLYRTLMNVAGAAIVIGGLGLLFHEGKEAWGASAIGFSLGYALIALILSAFLRPAVRGAGGPLILAGLVGWLVSTSLFAALLALPEPPDAVAIAALLAILVAAGWSGWLALRYLAISYASKGLSDMQLALGVYWTLLTVFMLGTVIKDPLLFFAARMSAEWVCVCMAALWLLWLWLERLALHRAVRAAERPIGALLFLRVFKPSGRSEEFADRFFAYWRFAAPVWMIAGPDLAGAYLDPSEFFAYLGGHLREHFIAGPGEASARVRALDNARDPDGRCRVNTLFCSDQSWQSAVLAMIDQAGVILLDLREYSQQRRGVTYELSALLRHAPLGKVIVLIDAKDDLRRLTAEVESIWREVGGARNGIFGLEDLQVLEFGKGSNAEMQGLFRASVRAATYQCAIAH